MRFRTLILRCFILLFTAVNVSSTCVGSQEAIFTQLVELYKKSLDREESNFNKLNFTLAPKEMQMQKIRNYMGVAHKILLKDNEGGYWIFKPGNHEIRAVSIYRIFKLVGLDTPPTFWINLKINSKFFGGGIQRFVTGAKTLENIDPSQLDKECLDYLLRTYTLQWLFANYDSEERHFLALLGEGKVKKIMRIDNTSCLSLLGKDKLDLEFYPPYWKTHKISYYYKVWEGFINNKIELDLKQNLIFIRFLEDIPDEIIIELIKPALKYEFNSQTDVMLQYLIKRKHRLSRDFTSFYKKIMSQKKSKLVLPNNHEIEEGIKETITSSIKNFEKEVVIHNNAMNYQVSNYTMKEKQYLNINVIASIEGWHVIAKRISDSIFKKREVPLEEYDKMLNELSQLKEKSSNNYEKIALDYYIREVKDLINGKKNIMEIERIIELP